LIKATPSREAAIWYCSHAQQYIVVQGSGNWITGAVNAPQFPGVFHIVEHFHPERNFAVQFASVQDFTSLVALYGGTAALQQSGQRIQSTIRYINPATGRFHFSYFGYDPHLAGSPVGPYFLNIETKGGARLDMSFRDMHEYQQQLGRLQAGIEVPQ
jgi:hypothetical protein